MKIVTIKTEFGCCKGCLFERMDRCPPADHCEMPDCEHDEIYVVKVDDNNET